MSGQRAHAPGFHPDPLPEGHRPTVGWIDDEELEEVRELLWRGYAPPRHVRMEWDFYMGGADPGPRPFVSERERAAIRAEAARENRALERRLRLAMEKAEVAALWARFPKGGLCFVCDICGGRFTSPIPEDEVELEYLATFAGRIEPVDRRRVLCEGCFDIMSRTGGGNARIAR